MSKKGYKVVFMKILIALFALMMVSGVTFEPAAVDQAGQLSRLAIDSNGYWGYRTVPQRQVRRVLGITREQIRAGTVRIMKEEGEVLGFFALSGGRLTFFFLKPAFIGKGYGRLLFQEMARVAKEELKWSELRWESDPFAVGFYLKMGAEELGRVPCPLNPAYQSTLFFMRFYAKYNEQFYPIC